MNKVKAVHVYILLIVASLAIIFALYNKLIPILFHHVIYLCQQTQSFITLPLPHTGPLLISGIFVALMLSGVIKTILEIIKTKSVVHKLIRNKVQIPEEILPTIAETIPSGKVDVIQSEQMISMCYGLFNPRICISTALITSLNREELKCVLIHENVHLKNYDPIKLLSVQLISSLFFFIPILKDFQKHFYLLQETKADRSVLNNEENKKHLRTALAKFLKINEHSNAVAFFASENNLEERINVLVGLKKHPVIKFSITNAVFTFFFTIVSLSLLNSPLYAMQTSASSHSYVICTAGSQCISYCKENTVLEAEEENQKKMSITPQLNYSSIK